MTPVVTEFVLVAEDDASDAMLLQRVFRRMTPPIAHNIVSNGEEVMAYLQGREVYADRFAYPFPTTVLLDLKMPRKNGFEVLQWMKSHPECGVVPTIVWSSSQMPQDVQKAYALGANCYIVKPSSLNEIEKYLSTIFTMWRLCEKPSCPARCS